MNNLCWSTWEEWLKSEQGKELASAKGFEPRFLVQRLEVAYGAGWEGANGQTRLTVTDPNGSPTLSGFTDDDLHRELTERAVSRGERAIEEQKFAIVALKDQLAEAQAKGQHALKAQQDALGQLELQQKFLLSLLRPKVGAS